MITWVVVSFPRRDPSSRDARVGPEGRCGRCPRGPRATALTVFTTTAMIIRETRAIIGSATPVAHSCG